MTTTPQAQCECLDLTKLEPVFKRYKDIVSGALIPILQAAQDVYGYLPIQILEAIAVHLDVPISQVYGVVTFYAQFHLDPRGKHIVRTCQGTACHVRGAGKILDSLKQTLGVIPGHATEDLQFTLETVACIGACGLAPVMMVDHDTHGRLKPGDISGILDKYRE
ncbi:MAG: NADH dehydrogenase [Candidatus Adiutrix intracellularis]|jgi:NADH-quinone oxidoreductase subunit E|nr:MAG: NADH dehydrogenase [Candidatus Adiutrix intracellularis]MDR2826839.1 NADH-quinone oxidoreductase subunit NuoE [Candidatus Adiutrix intracellularis]